MRERRGRERPRRRERRAGGEGTSDHASELDDGEEIDGVGEINKGEERERVMASAGLTSESRGRGP